MNIKSPTFRATVAVAIVLTVGGIGLALQNPQLSNAVNGGEVITEQTKVETEAGKFDNLESGTSTGVVDQPAQASKAAAPAPQQSTLRQGFSAPLQQSTTITDSEPAPAPAPVVTNPRTIVSIIEGYSDTQPGVTAHHCIYYLYDGSRVQITVPTCQATGSILN